MRLFLARRFRAGGLGPARGGATEQGAFDVGLGLGVEPPLLVLIHAPDDGAVVSGDEVLHHETAELELVFFPAHVGASRDGARALRGERPLEAQVMEVGARHGRGVEGIVRQDLVGAPLQNQAGERDVKNMPHDFDYNCLGKPGLSDFWEG